ncbi:aminobenzoate synthetase [Staphylococcus succinus]|nr:aminobenzoate synthetase [Staphylococcus succinus]
MQIQYNYRYLLDEDNYEQHQYTFTHCIGQKIAESLDQVGEVIRYAETKQKEGYYVALYLPYEAAPFFNSQMETALIEGTYIYGAAYVFAEQSGTSITREMPYIAKCNFQFRLGKETLIDHIKAVQDAIIEGNTYQVNYTTRLIDDIHYPIYKLYEVLQRENNGFYSALIDTEEIQVASLSPELFFQRGPFGEQEDVLLSKPMKGTIARGETAIKDQENLQTLANSAKDRAENVMIVDLLRNDIGRIANTGTVKVYKPFHIEAYNTVFQMTTMVTGGLRHETQLMQVLESLFPCGSITGAPKINTMKYIKLLEQVPRHIYCGTIGLLLPNGKSIFNVPIRTIQYLNNKAIYGVGAGITIDSIPELEVQEFKDKTKILERL